MKTTSINGIRRYENGDLADITTQWLGTTSDIDVLVNGIFDTKAAADAAYNAFTANGGVLRTGMVRTIGGFFEIYRNGGWRGVQSIELQTQTFYETTYGNGDEAGVAVLNIPDFGGPVYATVSGVVSVAATAGSQVRGVIRIDQIEGTPASAVIYRSAQFPGGESLALPFTPYRVGPLTNAHTLIVGIRRTLGSGNWGVSAGGNQLYASIVSA